MKTIAETASDFADLRMRAKGGCIYVGLSFDSKTRRLADCAWRRDA